MFLCQFAKILTLRYVIFLAFIPENDDFGYINVLSLFVFFATMLPAVATAHKYCVIFLNQLMKKV